jgi:V8-like Glu-specific endopeptidase
MITAELIQQTEGRFAERQAIRQERETKIRAGAVLEADDPDRVRKRIEHVARAIIETEGAGLPAQGPGVSALERIIGKNDLMSVRFLELALRIARTVGRIDVRGPDGTHAGYGTGFLVSPRLMLTNNHVLTDATAAGYSRVEFDFQEGLDGKLQTSIFASFDPAAFFTTDRTLDFSLVALKGDLRKITPYGWNGLSAAEGKIIVGEYVTIIQHPSGERKQLALRENQVVDVLDNFLHYHTDTSPGSSGSPVFNDQWEIVALHHSGVPKKDAQGRILTRDGRVYNRSMSEKEIAWIANEGVRISRILKHLEGLSLSGSQAALRKQVLESEKGWQGGAAAGGRELGPAELVTESAGNLWTLPLELTVDVGRAVSGVGIRADASREMPAATAASANGQPADRQPTSGQPASASELASAVAALESATLQPSTPAAPAESALEWLVGGTNGSGAGWP